jgi:fused signal recognition particle receptor
MLLEDTKQSNGKIMSLFKNFNLDKLKKGLTKTRNNLVAKISETITRKAKLDINTIEELEEVLVSSDIGFKISENIIEKVRSLLIKESDRSIENIKRIIKDELVSIVNQTNSVKDFEIGKYKPFVILIIGVNGSGKTTSIGKLAHNFKSAGLNVVIGSADTFRAAANDQLDIWAKRANVSIVESKSSDPSAVAYDTIQVAKKNNADVVLIDTAGRLHTQKNLMEELSKIKKVVSNNLPYAPNEILLVIDGTAGQNALYQAQEFNKFTDITGLIISKLDGTAKGGIVFQICNEKKIPIRYIGIGEGIEDLQNFDANAFVEAIFE